MFHKLVYRVQRMAERFIVWSLRRCLANYSAVIVRELRRIDTEAEQFKSEVKFVAADHFLHLNELHTRLLKLEGKS